LSAPRVDDAVGEIERSFLSAEGMAYLGEQVTMIQHQLQAAALANGSGDALVAAALLHDIGHMLGREGGATRALAANRDAHHDSIGARWLARWFGLDVTEPVRLHVAAKRYLVAIEPGYAVKLSAASVHTLRLQGGPMSPTEVREFEALEFARDAIAVRRFDEAAKDPNHDAPGFDTHRDLLARLIERAGSETAHR
jgi:gamma-butyrobetaine dioxygenase